MVPVVDDNPTRYGNSNESAEGDSEGARVLQRLGREAAQRRHEAYAVESDRHRDALGGLLKTDGSVGEALRGVRLTASDRFVERPRAALADLGELPVLDQPSRSLGLSVRGRPFDFDWHDAQDWGTPDANRNDGTMSLQVDSGGTPGDTDNTWNGAGVGIRFRPQRGVNFLRVAGYLPYDYRWHDDSTLQVAHNRGQVGILIREIGGGTVLDTRDDLWSDGTSWYQEHGDDQDGVFNRSAFIAVTAERDLEIWFWVNSSIDYSHETSSFFDFSTSSSASNDLHARLGFIVVEQFGH